MEERHQDVITKLKFLSKIQAGEKINVEELRLEKDGVILSAKRKLWRVDSRENSERFIREVIGSGLEEISKLGGSKREESIRGVLLTGVRESLKGIRGLKGTYNEDTYFCCGIDTYIELIEAKLLELESIREEE